MGGESTLEETPTWAVAVVCFVLVVISIFIEHGIHLIGKWLKNKHKPALYEALEKIKSELMLLGFISLLLTVLQDPISNICISKSIGATWHPCNKETEKESKTDSESDEHGRKLLGFLESSMSTRRSLAGYDNSCPKGKVPFMSYYAIHQLHIFIFVLAVFHVLFCITTLALGRAKMRKWKSWEDETKTIEYQFNNDPERFRFARDTSFGRRHLNVWSQSPVLLWIVCFFRQFFTSVAKVDYLTLRHGFIMAHLAPQSQKKFDFQKYINRSLEEDFKVVVGISSLMWFFSVLLLLTNTYGWHSYLWLPFIPLIIILLVGTKLQVIITQMGLRIQDRGNVVKGAPLVELGDDLFWFNRPHFILHLIHFVQFQNAFQLAFFAWSWYEFGFRSCFHKRLEDVIIRITMGVIIQFLCSYATLPLYALVTQMGSNMKPTIFGERVAAALQTWHHTAKKHIKHSRQSGQTTPFSSRPTTPSHDMSPVHLLRDYQSNTLYSPQTSPRGSNFHNASWDAEGFLSPRNLEVNDSQHNGHSDLQEQHCQTLVPTRTQLPPGSFPIPAQHEINISLADFSFDKRRTS